MIEVHHGHLISWKPDNHREVFYISPLADIRWDKAIRGGVPICWPWFADVNENGTSHGFARTSKWQQEDEPHKWRLLSGGKSHGDALLFVSFQEKKDALKITLTTKNIGKHPLDITCALHSYFLVSDLSRISIQGLNNTSYFDKLDRKRKVHNGNLEITSEIDRIYDNERTLILLDEAWQRKVLVRNISSHTVIWNPGKSKVREIADMPDDDYRRFVCIEAGNVIPGSMTVHVGEEAYIAQEINVSTL